MKARIGVLVMLFALLMAAPVAWAQAPSIEPAAPEAAAILDDATSPIIEGLVVSMGNTSLVINADDGTTRTFLVDLGTTMPAAEVAAGQRVAVRYRPLDADRAQALSVASVDSTTAAPGSVPAGGGVPAPAEPAATADAEPRLLSPVLMGIAGFVVLAIVIWMVTRRRPSDELFHIS